MMQEIMKPDYLIIGAGIMGMATARALLARKPTARIIILEKETGVGFHASGRNSGVLHAGFYYTADSLKAKFCRDGNKALHEYCAARDLKVLKCGKVVVATHESEMEGVRELARRGVANGVDVRIIDEKELAEIEPNARTHGIALYSPTTSAVSPTEVCAAMQRELEGQGVIFLFETPYEKRLGDNAVQAGGKRFEAGMVINCAGLYADKIAREFGFSEHYTIIPFKGVYLQYTGAAPPLRAHVYGVPNLKNPFLGAHFGLRVDGGVRIGPTAMPAFWREQYDFHSRFSLGEVREILGWEATLFAKDAFRFRALAWEEIRKYSKPYLIAQAFKKVKNLRAEDFREWSRPGIRAQLLDTRSLELLQDFVVEGDAHSVHVLNAVSPAFTCSLPFGEWMVEKYIA